MFGFLMKTYAASIEFSSMTLSLKEICTLLEKPATPDSNSMGDIKFERQGPRKYSDLRFFSDAPKDATLLEHFLDAQRKLGSYDKLKVQGHDIRCEVSLAVFYDTPFSTF